MSDSVKIKDLRTPEAIECGSMAIIDAEVPEPRPYAGDEWIVVRRMIHATADFELLDLVRFHPDAVTAALNALAHGGLVLTDTEMARAGLPVRRFEPFGSRVECLMNDPEVIRRAGEQGSTRATVAVDVAAERYGGLAGAILLVGNAPTALLRILERCRDGSIAPALVLGMPVGFVNAAESKALLMEQSFVPYIAVSGRKGGSALAAAALNALAQLALDRRSADQHRS
ncbi:precorrin-8X methylmutase [Oceanidesulfovibrio indonesiensis]|uniref:Precorrin-8X methylmutase n=1 Tax=Oceanidesulfovibrio indonesiensis TaxID=54767 RepID=A0A7M3MFT3_9BACT|nr:precorrin-8X methylmutase [Oceanidesulfovibrio indonesiensis]TVM17976.1 precorrin-8X methylmutase [Oceanidesulfovibrio indonesiensis]